MYFREDRHEFKKDWEYMDCRDIICALALALGDERKAPDERICEVYEEATKWYKCASYDIFYDDVEDILSYEDDGEYNIIGDVVSDVKYLLEKWDDDSLKLMFNFERLFDSNDNSLLLYYECDLPYYGYEELLSEDKEHRNRWICDELSTELDMSYLDDICYELQYRDFLNYHRIVGGYRNLALRNYIEYEIDYDTFEYHFKTGLCEYEISFVDMIHLEAEGYSFEF
jgi:hypothetical protein